MNFSHKHETNIFPTVNTLMFMAQIFPYNMCFVFTLRNLPSSIKLPNLVFSPKLVLFEVINDKT